MFSSALLGSSGWSKRDRVTGENKYSLVLKPFTSDRDLNSAKTHGLPTKITDLVSAPNRAQVLNVSLQKAFSERQNDR